MSLILEALRKSEAERRRGDLPDLRAELPPPTTAKRISLPRALPWLIAIVAICIAITLLLHPWSRTNPPAAPVVAVATPAPLETVRLQPRPNAVAATPPPVTQPVEHRPPPKPQPATVVAAPAHPPTATVAVVEPEPAPDVASLPETARTETPINALPADLRKVLPPLQLSMHMFDPDPAKRFVILDGERYSEGDSVGPMRIRRIDADGVLFDWQGRALRLPLR